MAANKKPALDFHCPLFSIHILPAANAIAKLPFLAVCELLPIQKWQLVPGFKAGGGFEPEEYMKYFEDSDSTPNAEIGCKMPLPDYLVPIQK